MIKLNAPDDRILSRSVKYARLRMTNSLFNRHVERSVSSVETYGCDSTALTIRKKLLFCFYNAIVFLLHR